MKPLSMTLRLALLTGLASAILICAAAGFGYWTLGHQLDLRSEHELAGKMTLVRHAVSEEPGAALISSDSHGLRDLLLGHDDLHLAIMRPGETGPAALFGALARDSVARLPAVITDTVIVTDTVITAWTLAPQRRLLSATGEGRTHNGERVLIYLTATRDADDALLRAMSGALMLWMPAALLLIALSAWFGVRTGLRSLRAFRDVVDSVTASDLTRRVAVEQLPKELQQPAAAFNTMLERLGEGVTRLSQFSADLAHELRTPLANLLGKTQMILSQARSADEYRSALESNIEEFERMSRIASDMLFLAQADHAQVAARHTAVALGDEAALVCDYLALAAEEKNINVVLTGKGSVDGDREMIQRAITNLLSNAIRHTPRDGRVEIRIETLASGAVLPGNSTVLSGNSTVLSGNSTVLSANSTALSGSSIVLSVSNPGDGIAAEHLDRIFERFYRVDTGRAREHGGTGLGLAIVQSIMRLHGGAVRVSSAAAGPTVFALVFPAQRAA